MGWREFQGWMRVYRQQTGGGGRPERLDDPVSRHNWDELSQVRERLRGRAR